MPNSRVLQFAEYRSRRDRRFEQACALYSADRERAHLLQHLWSAASIVGGDRAAVVWVDEYGPGLVHAHVILDLVSETPRRIFSAEALKMAWSDGVPGLYDAPDRDRPNGVLELGGHRSLCVVALGSDGLRAWFVVVDGQTPRTALSNESRAQMMFVAGECAAILMHRDMKAGDVDSVLVPEGGVERFAGWPVLKDIEGHENDERTNRRISCRFLVTRVVRALLDDDLATDVEALGHQIEAVRREIGDQFASDVERGLWEGVLDAIGSCDRVGLAKSILALGVHAEDLGHIGGARELYRSAYQTAMAVGAEATALDAARFSGRAWRRSSQWDRALKWYGVARSLAQAGGDLGKEAVVLDGVANIHKERGNLPKARQVLDEALGLAEESGDRYALGSTYHDLMAVSGMSGRYDEAIQMGWRAVHSYDREQDQLHALTSLAETFLKAGELRAAEDAFAVVARRGVGSFVYRLYALAGFANVAARQGDRPEFDRRLAVLEGAGFQDGPPAFLADAWLGRAEGYLSLGDRTEAARCLHEAAAVARTHKLGQFRIQAEDALESLARQKASEEPPPELTPDIPIPGMEEIREELGRMRDVAPALAGV